MRSQSQSRDLPNLAYCRSVLLLFALAFALLIQFIIFGIHLLLISFTTIICADHWSHHHHQHIFRLLECARTLSLFFYRCCRCCSIAFDYGLHYHACCCHNALRCFVHFGSLISFNSHTQDICEDNKHIVLSNNSHTNDV